MTAMKKRLVSLLCTLALCLGLLPTTALAAAEGAPNKLYVGNQSVTSGDEVTYWVTDSSTGQLTRYTDGKNDWNVEYNPGTATLTLKDATIKSTYSNGPGAVIYAQSAANSAVSLTIQLEGKNTIECDTAYYGIYVEAERTEESRGTAASLTITGNGSLEVSGSSYGISVKSGTGNASLTINDASVKANTTSTANYYAGVYVMSSSNATDSPKLSLAVNGGSLTASGGTSSDGIQFYVGDPDATNATTSLTVSGNAIVDARTGGIKATRVSTVLPTPTPTGENSSGIVFDGTEGTVYGNVTLDESLTIDQDETLTIPQGSTLNGNSNLTNNGTVTIENGGTLNGSDAINNTGTINVENGGNLGGTPTGTVVYAPTITTENLPDGEVGTAYSQTLIATGDTPITWTVSGDLPDGLTLNSDGTITGTPTTEGTSTFTVTAENSAGSTSQEYTLTIGVKPSYTISADTAALNFGSVLPGYTQPEAVTVTITNTGNQPLTLDQPASTANFEVGTLSATDLPVQGTATFTVQPKAGLSVGTYSENIVVSASHDVEISIPGSFTVVATDDPLVDTSLTVTPGISAGISGTAFDTAEKVRAELARVLVQDAAFTAGNTAFYDVKLQYSLDDGKTWVEATEAGFPAEGITVTLPYPQGTGKDTHNFRVVHMFTETSARLGTTAGQTETPGVTKTDSGLQVTLKGLSPVVIGWSKIVPQITATPAPATTASADTTTYYTCPACGTHNWTATDNGYRCDNCGYLESVKQLSGYGNVKGTYTPGSNSSSAAAAGAVSAPPTGDTSNPVLWTVVLAAACVVLGVATWARRRQD